MWENILLFMRIKCSNFCLFIKLEVIYLGYIIFYNGIKLKEFVEK